jgi:hypothetical protein
MRKYPRYLSYFYAIVFIYLLNVVLYYSHASTYLKKKSNQNAPSEINHLKVYHQHSRKAGGTTLRGWGNNRGWLEAQFTDSQIVHQEGLTLQDAQRETCKRGEHFCVTTLRDPIERAVSSYLYEVRMGREDLKTFKRLSGYNTYMRGDIISHNIDREMLDNLPPLNDSLVYTQYRTWDEWVAEDARDFYHFEVKQMYVRRDRVWMCSSNCFVKWFSGFGNDGELTCMERWKSQRKYPPNCQGDVTEKDYEKARAALNSFTAICISKMQSDADYASEIYAKFPQPELPLNDFIQMPPFGLLAKYRNLLYPWKPSEVQLEELRR